MTKYTQDLKDIFRPVFLLGGICEMVTSWGRPREKSIEDVREICL
jgi:hypothetical protein